MSLRSRGLHRAATIAEGQVPSPDQTPRRNSTFSDSVSDARNTIRSSTDDLLFPRAGTQDDDLGEEESPLGSAPLLLALLPALAGIFFKNGSAFVTDVTLLLLAAVFLNWSVRLPWDWYRSARTIRHQDTLYDPLENPTDLETHLAETAAQAPSPPADRDGDQDGEPTPDTLNQPPPNLSSTPAVRELQIHELAALAACFVFPLLGTWILHTIRSSLSRPSEGLVSNYNLTIFLLAAEIRPLSHLLKMVQARTLHLQRIVVSDADSDHNKDATNTKIDPRVITDLSKRLEELEAYVAETAALRIKETPATDKGKDQSNDKNIDNDRDKELTPQEQEYTLSVVSQAAAEYRKGFQADIDALNRAVRRYEKRTAVTAYQTQTQIQNLEAKLYDALSLAAAAQSQAQAQARAQAEPSGGLFFLALNWLSAAVFLPVQIGISLATLPISIATRGFLVCRDVVFGRKRAPRKPVSNQNSIKGKAPQVRRPLEKQRRTKRATIVEE